MELVLEVDVSIRVQCVSNPPDRGFFFPNQIKHFMLLLLFDFQALLGGQINGLTYLISIFLYFC